MKKPEAHPWLTWMTSAEDQEDSAGEVIRYTLDELRFASGFNSMRSPFSGSAGFFLFGFCGMIWDDGRRPTEEEVTDHGNQQAADQTDEEIG